MNRLPNRVLWMPPGPPAVARLGLAAVKPGRTLSPGLHESLLKEYVQDMVDKAGISKDQLDTLIDYELGKRGFTVACRRLYTAGMDLVDALRGRLRATGALITSPVYVDEQPDQSPSVDEMTIWEWIEAVALLLSPTAV